MTLEGDYHIQEIHKELMHVKETVLKQIDNKVILLLRLSNNKIIAYENLNSFPNVKQEKFRFKIIQS